MAIILSCIYIWNNLAGKLQVDGSKFFTSLKLQNYNLLAQKVIYHLTVKTIQHEVWWMIKYGKKEPTALNVTSTVHAIKFLQVLLSILRA